MSIVQKAAAPGATESGRVGRASSASGEGAGTGAGVAHVVHEKDVPRHPINYENNWGKGYIEDMDQLVENWRTQNAIYYGPKRDMRNYPPPRIAARTPPVRLGFVPASWFPAFYSKTGVSGIDMGKQLATAPAKLILSFSFSFSVSFSLLIRFFLILNLHTC